MSVESRLTPFEDLPGFGKGNVDYFGQTFIATSDTLNSISFMIDAEGLAPTQYKVLVTTVQEDNGFNPHIVIFETDSVLVEPVDGSSNFHIVTVNTESLNLVAGHEYAFLLDAFATSDDTGFPARLGASYYDVIGSTPAIGVDYVPGHFVTFSAPSGSTRASHFATGADWTDWDGDEKLVDIDLAFSLTFSDKPVIVSNGGEGFAAITHGENIKAVTTVTTDDSDVGETLTYSIVGGTDSAKFVIDAATGALSFIEAPDFEAAADADGDNNYGVTVRVTDSFGNVDAQLLEITVANDMGATIHGTKKNDKIDGTIATASEDIILGNAGNDKLSGLAGFDLIDGGKGNDKLFGGDGDDRLIGGKGKDKLTGEAGEDAFVFNASFKQAADKITDFSVLDDTVVLSQSVFKVLGLGVLADTSFHLGKEAADADDYILYDNGKLLYDADGSGKGDAIVFAKLGKGLALTNLDFEVVA